MTDKEKQIEEIAKHCCFPCDMECNGECLEGNDPCKCYISLEVAKTLYNAGYRKQVEGEWVECIEYNELEECEDYFFRCSVCGLCTPCSPNFCPNCGANMKGGD